MLKTFKIILIFTLSFINSDNESEKIKINPMSIYEISINDINGDKLNMSEFKGKYILFVNVASNCGFTKQYKDLQKLYNESCQIKQ